MSKRKINAALLVSTIFLLSIVLMQYSLYGIGMGYYVLLLMVCVLFVLYRKVFVEMWLLIYMMYCFLFQFIYHHYFHGDEISGLSIVLCIVIIVFISPFIHINKLYETYKVIGGIAIIGLFYQAIMVYLFNQNVNMIKIINIDVLWANNYSSNRPVSFFTEPQAYATFILPFLFLSLKFRDFILSIIITLSVFMSTSSQGIIISVILWLLYIYYEKKSIYKIVVSLLGIVFLGLFLVLDVFSFARVKIFGIDIYNDVRLSRGFYIFSSLSGFEKWFGVGLGMENVKDYVVGSGYFDWAQGNDMAGYTSGISGLLVQYGIIGGLIMALMFVSLFYKSNKDNRMILMMILISSFSQNLVFNSWFVYYFVIYMSFSVEENEYGSAQKKLQGSSLNLVH